MPSAALRLIAALLLLLGASAAPAAERAIGPGRYLWYADLSDGQPGAVSIVVSIPSQIAYVYRGGALIGASSVSTGKPGKETPPGTFTILEKDMFHRSNKYSNAPMPFMQRLTWSGIALHGGHLPGYPASHGCIRLPLAFARELYKLTRLGAVVRVVDEALSVPAVEPQPKAVPIPPAVPPQQFVPDALVPRLIADVRGLGGEAFNVVTMRDASGEVEDTMRPVARGSRS